MFFAQFGDVISSLVKTLLTLCSDSSMEVHLACAECIGELGLCFGCSTIQFFVPHRSDFVLSTRLPFSLLSGAIDPGHLSVDMSTTERADKPEGNLAIEVIQDMLVKALKAATSTQAQDRALFAIQVRTALVTRNRNSWQTGSIEVL